MENAQWATYLLHCMLCLIVFIGIVAWFIYRLHLFYFSLVFQLNHHQWHITITTTQKNKRTSSNQHGNGSNISSNSKASAVSSTSSTSSKKTPITNIAIRSPPLPLPLPHQVQSVSSTIQYPNMNTLGMFTLFHFHLSGPPKTLLYRMLFPIFFLSRKSICAS